jgi:hypothetical protein
MGLGYRKRLIYHVAHNLWPGLLEKVLNLQSHEILAIRNNLPKICGLLVIFFRLWLHETFATIVAYILK